VTVNNSDTQADLPAAYTFTAAAAGAHAFSIKLGAAGLTTVTAADVVNAAIRGSDGINVTAWSGGGGGTSGGGGGH
jgi:hypothetical protein